MPVAAPNGAAVVFVAVRGMAVDLYAMDRDRPMPRNLTLEIFDVQSEPLVSPNSELVAMERSGGGVHLIPLDEELEIVTIEAEGLVSELEWTSEGTIRFIAGADAARQQFEYDITGSLVRRGPAGGGES